MKKSIFIPASEIAQELSISTAHAYKLIRAWNEELKARGFLVIPGRIPEKYFRELIYGSDSDDKDRSNKIAGI